MIALRQREPALQVGDYAPVFNDENILAYSRKSEDKQFLVILNMNSSASSFSMPHEQIKGTISLCTDVAREAQEFDTNIEMNGNEGMMIEIAQSK